MLLVVINKDSLMRGGLCGKPHGRAVNRTVDRRSCYSHVQQSSIRQPDIGRESRFLPTLPAFGAPVRGPVGILPIFAHCNYVGNGANTTKATTIHCSLIGNRTCHFDWQC